MKGRIVKVCLFIFQHKEFILINTKSTFTITATKAGNSYNGEAMVISGMVTVWEAALNVCE